MQYSGNILKMRTGGDGDVTYALPIGDELVELNPLIGQPLQIHYGGEINCVACGRKTKKSYSQGHCYPCSQRLASCDLCIMKPETCHYDSGTCREPEWGEANCMQRHYVYLANTSGLKVGITRGTQVPTRWYDQGATQALPILAVDSRYHSGLIEVALKRHVADRTDWRKMLKGDGEPMDLAAERDRLLGEAADELAAVGKQMGFAIEPLVDEAVREIRFPVHNYPEKIKALNLDKQPLVESTLVGIKGQYLIFEAGVLNVRKYGGYMLSLEV